jgi:Arc/MetJ-type ribon-helix-helix transcriptional regulator
MPLDYDAPAELFLSKRTKKVRENYRRFATAAEAIRYAVETLRTPKALAHSCRSVTSGSTAAKFSASTKQVSIRFASLSDQAVRARVRDETNGSFLFRRL